MNLIPLPFIPIQIQIHENQNFAQACWIYKRFFFFVCFVFLFLHVTAV